MNNRENASLFDASNVCPFCKLWHNPEKSNCDYHDGKKIVQIRKHKPITAGELETLK